MNEPHSTGAHLCGQPETIQDPQSKWLTVSEAVLHCTERGLSRTPKTVRKWAARSFMMPETGDISVRREDTEFGFRWSIELTSLDRKIDEELEFEARKNPEPDSTRPETSEPVPTENRPETINEPQPDRVEPVQTGADRIAGGSLVEAELRAQLEQTRAEVDFLREELIHRRQTDKALGSVIEAFRLNSEVNQSKALSGEGASDHPAWPRSARHDIVPNDAQESTE